MNDLPLHLVEEEIYNKLSLKDRAVIRTINKTFAQLQKPLELPYYMVNYTLKLDPNEIYETLLDSDNFDDEISVDILDKGRKIGFITFMNLASVMDDRKWRKTMCIKYISLWPPKYYMHISYDYEEDLHRFRGLLCKPGSKYTGKNDLAGFRQLMFMYIWAQIYCFNRLKVQWTGGKKAGIFPLPSFATMLAEFSDNIPDITEQLVSVGYNNYVVNVKRDIFRTYAVYKDSRNPLVVYTSNHV